jgi:hypothetical protein
MEAEGGGERERDKEGRRETERDRERQRETERERARAGAGGKEDAVVETSICDMIYTTSTFNCTYCN